MSPGAAGGAARRPAFARLARAVLEAHLPEAVREGAHWEEGRNTVWVRWRREDGFHVYWGLRRHLDWVTGEAGISLVAQRLPDLPPSSGEIRPDEPGFRVRLGTLMDGEDRWWPAGPDEAALEERLGWMALQMSVRGGAYFRRYRLGGGTGDAR